jgi:hypothetical protein
MCVHKNLAIYVSLDGQSTHSGAKRIAASKAKAKAKGKSKAKKGEEDMPDDLEEEEEDDDIDGEPIDDEDHQGEWNESYDGMDYSGYSADNWDDDGS